MIRLKKILKESKRLITEVDNRIPNGKFKFFCIETVLGMDQGTPKEENWWMDGEWLALLITDTNFAEPELVDERDGYKVDREDVMRMPGMDQLAPEEAEDSAIMERALGEFIERETKAKYFRKYRDLEKAINTAAAKKSTPDGIQ